MQLIKWIIWAIPFVLMCISLRKVNLNKSERGKQFAMPIIALVDKPTVSTAATLIPERAAASLLEPIAMV